MIRRSPLRRFWQFIQRENLHRLFVILVGMIALSTVGISLTEPGINLLNGLWWTVVTMTTVGYGDISPVSMGGRIIAMVIMFFGIGLLGMLSATIASVLVQKRTKENLGMSAYNYRRHIIVSEWNHRAEALLRELRADSKTAEADIVVIAEVDQLPLDDDYLHFVRGSVNDETLHRANLAEAEAVVILGDDTLQPMARDAKVVLATLTIESIRPEVYTIVELVDQANARHCERAHADEVIVIDDLTSGLLARATLDHGITKIVGELLHSGYGRELYKVQTPSALIGKSFFESLVYFKENYDSIAIGVESAATGAILTNPPSNLQLTPGDLVVVVATDRPVIDDNSKAVT